MGQTKLGESKISHEAFSPLKVRFFREAMRRLILLSSITFGSGVVVNPNIILAKIP